MIPSSGSEAPNLLDLLDPAVLVLCVVFVGWPLSVHCSFCGLNLWSFPGFFLSLVFGLNFSVAIFLLFPVTRSLFRPIS